MSRDVKEVSKDYFDTIAKDYNNSFDGKFVDCMYQEIINRVAAMSKEPESILDLGCGNGNVELLLADRTKAKLYGIDLSSAMIEEAQKRLDGLAEFCVGDSQHLPYENNTFDIIICNASFHHYPEPLAVLHEVKRVLKKDGVLILGDPTVRNKVLLKLMNWSIKYSKGGDFHIYDKKEITAMLSSTGFSVTDWKKIDKQTFILNAANN